jgi:hypothetical protein
MNGFSILRLPAQYSALDTEEMVYIEGGNREAEIRQEINLAFLAVGTLMSVYSICRGIALVVKVANETSAAIEAYMAENPDEDSEKAKILATDAYKKSTSYAKLSRKLNINGAIFFVGGTFAISAAVGLAIPQPTSKIIVVGSPN